MSVPSIEPYIVGVHEKKDSFSFSVKTEWLRKIHPDLDFGDDTIYDIEVPKDKIQDMISKGLAIKIQDMKVNGI